MSGRRPARACVAGRAALGGRVVPAGSVVLALQGHASLCTRIAVCMPPVATGMDRKCRWRRNLEDAPPRMPGSATGVPVAPGSRGLEAAGGRVAWTAGQLSAVVRSTWCPDPCRLRLGAGAHSAALDLQWESPQPLVQSPLLCPMSLVPFSTQVTSGLRLSPSAHSFSRSPEPPQARAVHQLPSLRPRKRAPSWTSFLGCIW